MGTDAGIFDIGPITRVGLMMADGPRNPRIGQDVVSKVMCVKMKGTSHIHQVVQGLDLEVLLLRCDIT